MTTKPTTNVVTKILNSQANGKFKFQKVVQNIPERMIPLERIIPTVSRYKNHVFLGITRSKFLVSYTVLQEAPQIQLFFWKSYTPQRKPLASITLEMPDVSTTDDDCSDLIQELLVMIYEWPLDNCPYLLLFLVPNHPDSSMLYTAVLKVSESSTGDTDGGFDPSSTTCELVGEMKMFHLSDWWKRKNFFVTPIVTKARSYRFDTSADIEDFDFETTTDEKYQQSAKQVKSSLSWLEQALSPGILMSRKPFSATTAGVYHAVFHTGAEIVAITVQENPAQSDLSSSCDNPSESVMHCEIFEVESYLQKKWSQSEFYSFVGYEIFLFELNQPEPGRYHTAIVVSHQNLHTRHDESITYILNYNFRKSIIESEERLDHSNIELTRRWALRLIALQHDLICPPPYRPRKLQNLNMVTCMRSLTKLSSPSDRLALYRAVKPPQMISRGTNPIDPDGLQDSSSEDSSSNDGPLDPMEESLQSFPLFQEDYEDGASDDLDEDEESEMEVGSEFEPDLRNLNLILP